jgi:hypothetical protein
VHDVAAVSSLKHNDGVICTHSQEVAGLCSQIGPILRTGHLCTCDRESVLSMGPRRIGSNRNASERTPDDYEFD